MLVVAGYWLKSCLDGNTYPDGEDHPDDDDDEDGGYAVLSAAYI